MRWGALLATVTLLTACATPQRAVLPGEELWSGRLAMTVQSVPPQSFSAGFELRGTPDAGELQLTSPLGTSIATVVWLPGSAEMRQGGQITRRGSLDELTTEFSGTPVPVAALFGWLRGQTADVPGWRADLARQPEGRITAHRFAPLPAAELRVVVQP
jgi:outer membrane lipoprotein LolB